MRKDTRGFTLIEIVVVVLIVGVLSGIAVQNFNKVRTKAEAARIATQLHYLEDAVIEAIISGATQADFASIFAADVEASVLGDFFTAAEMQDVPEGMQLSVSSAPAGNGFNVWLTVQSDTSHEAILAELEAMFPRTLNRVGDIEWVAVNSEMLSVRDRSTP
jgi:prepilin-type N-terminal cleavage/methylation domain-containing protein